MLAVFLFPAVMLDYLPVTDEGFLLERNSSAVEVGRFPKVFDTSKPTLLQALMKEYPGLAKILRANIEFYLQSKPLP